MKSVTDTNVQLIKEVIKTGLEKAGHSLEELETAISTGNTEKTAGLLKIGAFGDILTALGIGGKGLSLMAGAGAIAGGTGIYGAYKGLEDTQKKIDEQEAIRQRILMANKELEAQLMQPQVM